jgi:alkaline phosphatase D
LSRRDLLKIAWALGAAAVAPPVYAQRVARPVTFDAYPFALGVASGDPLPDAVVIWTRLAPHPLEDGGGVENRPVEVGWEVAGDDSFTRIVQTGKVIARPEVGHSIHVDVTGLEPGRDYWYRFQVADAVSAAGRTRTAPAPGAAVNQVRFGVCGCANYELGYFTPLQHIAGEHFDFVVHTGDYIYENRSNIARAASLVRHLSGDATYTLAEYRYRYAAYKLDPDLQAAHASAPFVVTFDDHEVTDNWAAEFDSRGTPPEFFLLRRAAAFQAYYEAMPLRASAFPSGASMHLHRRLQFGNLVDLQMLDTRQYRSDQACGDGNKSGCAELNDPRRTMLGAEQERWLFDNLAAARARWTVIGQQVPTFAYDSVKVNPEGRFSMDRWDGYPAARARLYTQLQQAKTPNPILLSGDVHCHFGADLKVDFTDPKSAIIGSEFTNTSITCNGDGSEVAGSWQQTHSYNPHVLYNSNRRGYIACTATPETMRADFKIVERVSVPNDPIRIGGSLVVEAGHPGAVRA